MIKRSKRAKNFTVVNNEIYADNGLSFEAMGLLTYLLSKPDNWQINAKALAKVTEGTDKKNGINKIYSMLNVLIEAGYVFRQKNADGSVDYTIYDKPVHQNSEQQDPNHGNPVQAKPNHGNPVQGFSDVLIRTERQQELNVKKERNDNNPHTPAGDDGAKNKKTSDDVLAIFDFWKTTMGHAKAKLDGKRKKNITEALSWEYSVADLCQAIDGCSKTPHNIGQNDRGQRYDGLHIILRDADQIDRFMANSVNPPRAMSKQETLEAQNAQALADYEAWQNQGQGWSAQGGGL